MALLRVLSRRVPVRPCLLSWHQLHTDGMLTIPEETTLPYRAQVVIAGSGLVGNAVAYYLIQQGMRDVVILDKGNIADGRSKYGSGILGLFRPQHERKIVEECIDLYRQLQKDGYDIGLKECGSLNLAASRERAISLQHRASRYQPTGLQCEVMSPKEIQQLHPYLYVEDLHCGIWVPEDAVVHPKRVSETLALLAHQGGAKFIGNCGVQSVLTNLSNKLGPKTSGNARVRGVETEKGTIECEYFVNCAGIWAREVGKLSEPQVRVPICPADHFFLIFKDVKRTGDDKNLNSKDLPTVRDYDSNIYMREWRSSFMMGAFEREARPFSPTARLDAIDEHHWKHMAPYIGAANRRLPILKDIEYDYLLNSPDAFTPDGKWIMGEAAEVANYYMCVGMNGNSLQGAGGVGKVVAHWITSGHPPGDVLHFDVQRFTSLHNNPLYLHERTSEVVGRHYCISYPMVNEFEKARRIRTSPFFSELEDRGAVFGERMGWERPLYFDPFHSREDPPAQLPKPTFGKPAFFDNVEEEYLACREGVGVIDMSSFAKYQIKGDPKSVLDYLQFLCSNDVDVSVGTTVSTGMLNANGGYENDCLLSRLKDGSYFMVSPTQQQTRVLEYMSNFLPADNTVSLMDVTSMYSVLTVAGPKSKDMLQELTNWDMNMQPFTFKLVNMAYASGVMVMAVTQTGEQGFSLYIPSDHALHLYDKIMTVGHDYGARNVGHLAMRFLRIEKFIPFWGEELSAETTPLEVGRGAKVNFEKSKFIGKDALVAQKQRGLTKRLVQFQLVDYNKDTDLWLRGGEAIFRNGSYVGAVTNSAYGFTLHKMICLGFVQHPDTLKGRSTVINQKWLMDKNASWSVMICGRMFPATLHLHPPQMPSLGHHHLRQLSKSRPKTHVQVLRRLPGEHEAAN